MKRICLPLLLLLFTAAQGQSLQGKLDQLLHTQGARIAGTGGGLTLVVMEAHGELYHQSTGSFTATIPVPVASASKWYAATVLMRLVEAGKLRLSDKVSQYLPAFAGDKKDITLLQCFALTSGLPGDTDTLDRLMAQKHLTLAAQADLIARVPLVAPPGSQLNYGGLAMQVVGRVCEVAGGKPWNTLFRELVTEPLDMRSTFYAGVRTGAVPRIAGGVVSTAADYLHLLDMLAHKGVYRGKRLLSEALVATMLADQTGGATIGYSPFTKHRRYTLTGADARYGIGNWVILDGPIQVNTSPGAFGFTPWIDRKTGRYGVIAVRSSFVRVMPFFWQVLQVLEQEGAARPVAGFKYAPKERPLHHPAADPVQTGRLRMDMQ